MPTEFPLVTIVTPSFNQGKFIERTILSVLQQDYPNIEYIVMDALSSDETAAVLRKHEHRISRVVRAKDEGQSDALNKGFTMSSGTIMAYLNADDCFASASVVSDVVRQFAEQNNDVTYGRRYRITGEGYFLDCYPFREFDPESIKRFNIVPQEACFWTRDIYERSGAFVDKELQFSMDYEMWLRFLKHGATFQAIDTVYGYFRWHETQKSQVIWRDVCLPEVEKIQNKYSGFATSSGAMESLHESYYYGVDVTVFPREHQLAIQLWKLQLQNSRNFFADNPLDLWVYDGARRDLSGAVQ